MKKVLTIGGAVHDIFIEYKDPERGIWKGDNCLMIPEGRKTEVTALSHFSGGGATNSAVSFKRLGFEVASFFKVGADEAGEFVVDDVKNEGIDVSHALVTEQASTGTSFILQSPTGNHAILVDRGANLTLIDKELPLDLIRSVDQLYVTSLSGSTSRLLPIIAKIAKEAGVPLATNPGTSQLHGDVHSLKESLPFIDILILNAYESSLLMNTLLKSPRKTEKPDTDSSLPELLKDGALRDYFNLILAQGVHTAVVTNGSEGVYVATKKEIFFHPSIKTEVISSVGAGDAFASCFVASLCQGTDVEKAIRQGVINSASVLHYLGAKTGLLTTKELQQQLDLLANSLLKSYTL